MMNEVVAKITTIVFNKIQTLDTHLTSQTNNFATYTIDKATKILKKRIATLR